MQNLSEPLAIIGTGCRYPGESTSASKLWELCRNPRDVQKPMPEDRFSGAGFHNKEAVFHGNSNVRDAYTLSEDVKAFDNQFFGINPVEASSLDPQQRILLETVYEALEDAGLKISSLQGTNTGVYVGCMTKDYEILGARELDSCPTYHATGTSGSIISNRVSYFYDWTGPSMTIDTACSSSLVAFHQAAELLRSGRSRVAVASGSNLILGPDYFIALSNMQMLSSTGRSQTWDANANGYARGEGVATVIMKTLKNALADGDPIQCVVRASGTNQDGRTPGLTHPSSQSQAVLIRETYKYAGLDASNQLHHPQFFEAHGTGTPTGDPIEARAIHSAFYPDGKKCNKPIWVGSIKSMIGHTEGAAGLAGVIKSMKALQHAKIPPNMLFKTLNPEIKPFWGNLKLTTEMFDWPQPPEGQPRRASVNSFGFGGANAHAILESWDGPQSTAATRQGSPLLSPFVFSAATENSLREAIRKHASYLRSSDDVNMSDLAFTLDSRRTVHNYRRAFVASSQESLLAELDSVIKTKPALETRRAKTPKILGIFTGQGAQWATMGRSLLQQSPAAAATLDRLQHTLDSLPHNSGPTWKLLDVISAEGKDSRIKEAEISQPACTAVQIVLVDHLKAAGIRFKAVVGHSSGEIAAAYAAGHISAENAITVAYYRGQHAALAAGKNGEKGAMMAVSTTQQDAEELFNEPDLKGRIGVAACNAPTSITVSGDQDAVEEAKTLFEDEEKMAKMLFVDKAYHSHHMLRCSEAYVQSLKAANVKFESPSNPEAIWVSSVFNQQATNLGKFLNEDYWNKNMVRPVLFSQAVGTACEISGPFDVAIEVGPHPALKRPAIETYEAVNNAKIPYVSFLERGKDDLRAFSAGAASFWELFGDDAINLSALEAFSTGDTDHRMIVDLPKYQWSHEKTFWTEPRAVRAERQRKQPTHELLGNLLPDGSESLMRWRNYLSVKEVPWLEGHKLQEAVVIPAAVYISMALEAASRLAPERSRKLLEIRDLVIKQAITLPDDNTPTETMFTLTGIRTGDDNTMRANFTIESTVGKDAIKLTPNCSGAIHIEFGEPVADILPTHNETESNFTPVNTERFYKAMAELGYGWTNLFNGLSELRRNNGNARGLVHHAGIPMHTGEHLLVHAATFDIIIQCLIMAFCYPQDGQLFAMHVPTRVSSIRVNVGLAQEKLRQEAKLPFVSTLSTEKPGICGDVNIFAETEPHAMIQMEGIRCSLFADATERDDTLMFSSLEYGPVIPDGAATGNGQKASQYEYELALDLERVCFYYFNQWLKDVPEDVTGWRTTYQGLLRYIKHIKSSVQRGEHRHARLEWARDSEKLIKELVKKHSAVVDMKLINAIGQSMAPVLRGDITALEAFTKTESLRNEYINQALGYWQYSKHFESAISQLVHRHANMRVLEIGAGSGRATGCFFNAVGNRFSDYTFTDMTADLFDGMREKFSDMESKMKYDTLDINRDIESQGFKPHSYDVVVSSLVFQAAKNLRKSLENVRKLLRPGGFLVLFEVTNNEVIRVNYISGNLPQWFTSEEESRSLSPCIEPIEWHRALRHAGFAGVDSITSDQDRLPHPVSVIVSQAVDDRVEALRQPLMRVHSTTVQAIAGQDLLIIGSETLETSTLCDEIASILTPSFNTVTMRSSLEDVMTYGGLGDNVVVLSLLDLAEPVFGRMTESRFQTLKEIFETTHSIMLVSSGCWADRPEANVTLGFLRSLLWENTNLKAQHVDFEGAKPDSHTIAAALLRFAMTNRLRASGSLDSMLWTQEPEVVVTPTQSLIPRIKPNAAQNARFNSRRRDFPSEMAPRDDSIKAVGGSSAYRLEPHAAFKPASKNSETTLIVELSSANAVNLGKGHWAYVVYGTESTSKTKVIGISDTNASLLTLKKDRTFVLGCEVDADAFNVLLQALVAHTIFQDSPDDGDILVHEPSEAMSRLLAAAAAARGISMTCTSTEASKAQSKDWTYLHPRASALAWKAALPNRFHGFVDFSMTADSKNVGSKLRSMLPHTSTTLCIDNLYGQPALLTGLENREFVDEKLQGALSIVREAHTSGALTPTIRAVDAADLVNHVPTALKSAAISWKASSKLTVAVQPFDAADLFDSKKTFWLVGLASDLGLSLCDYMFSKGARHFVISSRNPNIDQKWLAKAGAKGASVKIVSCDVTVMDSLKKGYDEILESMPMIGGVVQGAANISDKLAADTSNEHLQKVLRPKIQGSINLTALFDTQRLDFFVFFSSVTAVAGNFAQTSYTAGNAFMTSLAHQRRKAGLAGSAVNYTAILGAGYVTASMTEQQQNNLLNKAGFTFMSEPDFHHAFAEAVVAGRPDSGLVPEITTGIKMHKRSDAEVPRWVDDARFAHQVDASDVGAESGAGGNDPSSVTTRLAAASTKEDVNSIITGAFLTALEKLLRVDLDKDGDVTRVLKMRTDDFGIDSLVAVEIRSWFLKVFSVNVPVLKILGGASLADIIAYAGEKLNPELTPSLGGETPAAAQAPAKVSAKPAPTKAPVQLPKADVAAKLEQTVPLKDVLQQKAAEDSAEPHDSERPVLAKRLSADSAVVIPTYSGYSSTATFSDDELRATTPPTDLSRAASPPADTEDKKEVLSEVD